MGNKSAYQSPVYGECKGKRGYLLIPMGEGEAYFHPWDGSAPIKCPTPDRPKSMATDQPFYPFMTDA